MHKFIKYSTIIKIYSLPLIGLFIFSFAKLQAADYAYVTTKNALIYADQKLEHPIGKTNKGKRVIVGKQYKKSIKTVPIIIKGKIAYMNINDLTFPDFKWNVLQKDGFTSSKKIQRTEQSLDHILQK